MRGEADLNGDKIADRRISDKSRLGLGLGLGLRIYGILLE